MATLNSTEDLVSGTVSRMGTNAENMSEDGFLVAAEAAELELGWSYPIDHPTKVLWAYNRSVRHCIHILMIESAHKFRYNKIFLQNRFEHYSALIKKMDDDFEKMKEENPHLFPVVGGFSEEFLLNGISSYIPNIRDYDIYGRE